MQRQTKENSSGAAKSGTPNALHTHIQTHKHNTGAPGHALSNPFLSPLQNALPAATHVDTEASGVAHKWTPTLSL